MNEFLKVANKENDCISNITNVLQVLVREKHTAGIFDWPQIRKMKNDKQVTESVTFLDRTAWDCTANMLKAFKKLGGNLSINVHFCSVTWTDSLITLLI